MILILFGADKAPQLARSLGNARAKLDSARSQFTEAIKTEEERAWDDQLAFERERERKVQEADPERQQLVRAAEELGLQTQGLTDAELKAAIRAKMGGAAPDRTSPRPHAEE